MHSAVIKSCVTGALCVRLSLSLQWYEIQYIKRYTVHDRHPASPGNDYASLSLVCLQMSIAEAVRISWEMYESYERRKIAREKVFSVEEALTLPLCKGSEICGGHLPRSRSPQLPPLLLSPLPGLRPTRPGQPSPLRRRERGRAARRAVLKSRSS